MYDHLRYGTSYRDGHTIALHTDFGGVGDVRFTQREQMSGAEGGFGSKKGRAEVESAFTGDGVCYWPHFWMWW